jgi:hypothetical protein
MLHVPSQMPGPRLWRALSDAFLSTAHIPTHTVFHAGSDWHLKMVEVLCVNSAPPQHCRFYYDAWLAKNEPPYQLEVRVQGRHCRVMAFAGACSHPHPHCREVVLKSPQGTCSALCTAAC